MYFKAYLFSQPDENGFGFVHDVVWHENDVVPDSFLLEPKIFPPFLQALRGLKFDKINQLTAGGIAGLLFHTSKLNEINATYCASENHLINYEELSTVTFPVEKLYMLQSSPHGDTFFVDEKQNVRVFSPYSKSFEIIGALNDFMRFCLYFVLEKKDWYRDGYYDKSESLKDYKLKFISRH